MRRKALPIQPTAADQSTEESPADLHAVGRPSLILIAIARMNSEISEDPV